MQKTNYRNPFPPTDKNRHELWEMLVRRDIEAFVQQDWSQVVDDFLEEEFMGISGHRLGNPDSWTLAYPTLNAYGEDWLQQAADMAKVQWEGSLAQALHDLTNLRDMDVQGNRALLHKKFQGYLAKKDGGSLYINFQTLYRCRQVEGRWKIAGFTGYLPFPMG